MTAKTKAEVALFGTTFIWGSTFVAQKIGLHDVSPLMLIVFRFALATVLLLLFMSKKIFPIPRHCIAKGALLGTFLFLGFAAQTIGLKYTTASKSAFITSMMVIGVPLLQFVMEKRPPTVGNIFGVVIVSAGLWFLTSPAGSSFNFGDALTLLCSFFFGLYVVYLDIASKQMTTLQLTFLQTASTGLLAFLSMLMFEQIVFVPTATLISTLLYLTIFATILTMLIQTRFQKDTTPTRAVIIFTVEPVFASLFAFFILQEQLGQLGILGGGLIIAGVLLSELSDLIPLLNRSFSWTQS